MLSKDGVNKTCSRCKKAKLVDDFSNSKAHRDGKNPQCIACGKEYRDSNKDLIRSRKKDYYERNKDSIRGKAKARYENGRDLHSERMRIWRESNPNYNSDYYANNKEYFSEYAKKYYVENKERLSEYDRVYRKSNPHIGQRQAQRRRALVRGAYVEGAYIPTYRELTDFYGAACIAPGCTNIDTTLDHVKPLSKGGLHELWNLQPLCHSHNSRKQDVEDADYRTGLVWIARLDGIGDVTCKVDYRFDSQGDHR